MLNLHFDPFWSNVTIVTFSSSGTADAIDYKLENHRLARVKSEKDLGVAIEHSLSWHEHTNKRCAKANCALKMSQRNSSKSIQNHVKLNMFKSMVVPIIRYASQAWFPSKSDFIKIGSIQRRATSWILNFPESTYHQRLLVLNLLHMSFYMQLNDLLTLSKIFLVPTTSIGLL